MCTSKAMALAKLPECWCYSHMLNSHGRKITHAQRDDGSYGTRLHALMSLLSQRDERVLATQPNTFNYIMTPTGKVLFLTYITEITILSLHAVCVSILACGL